ncbi:DUF3168 domain-containing protein [Novosphingobium sp.]|jgi:hypothetical protein|uniref:DUF3168 domain-containing protein n=1 Tax=Novosphingobium sp. TaxID=1874826 RepID=UPI002FDFB8B1
MKDPSFPLQKAVLAALTNAGLENVFYTVPTKTSLPWVVIGDDQILAENESAEMYECFATVSVFARKPNHKVLAAKVTAALDQKLVLEGFQTEEFWHEETRYFTEKDNQIGHASIEFRYLLQPI